MRLFRELQKGMGLAEAIIYVGIFTLAMFAIMTAVDSMYKSNAYTLAQANQVDFARRGVEIMVRDIREMTFADDGTFPLVRTEENLIGFYSDIDRDDSVEYVEYELEASTQLVKRVYNATGTPVVYDTASEDERIILSEYAQNLVMGTTTFRYFDTNGNEATATSSVTDIRFIQVRPIINVDPVRNPGQFELRSSAALRNVLDNL